MPMTGRVGLFVLAVTCVAAAQARGPLDLATAPVAPGARRIAYGTDPLQFGELRVPSTKGPHPVAIVVHGGCWVARLGTMDERAVAIDPDRVTAWRNLARYRRALRDLQGAAAAEAEALRRVH